GQGQAAGRHEPLKKVSVSILRTTAPHLVVEVFVFGAGREAERQIGVPRPVQGHILQRVPEVGPVGGIPQEAVVRVGLIDGSEGGRAGLGGGPGGIGGGGSASGAVANIDIARNAEGQVPSSLQV